MKTRLRLLKTAWRDAELNLALEWAMLELMRAGSSPNVLRLWTNGPCVVIDRSGKALAEVRLGTCEALGIPVLKRPTTGGAVYHDEGNLNWTVVMEKAGRYGFRWPSELEQRASHAILQLIKAHGLEGRYEARRGVFVRGRKISGIAMYIGQRAILVHGTLLVCSDLSALRGALKCKYEVASLSELTRSALDPWADVAPLLAEELARAFGAYVVEGRLSREELALAEELRPMARARAAWISSELKNR